MPTTTNGIFLPSVELGYSAALETLGDGRKIELDTLRSFFGTLTQKGFYASSDAVPIVQVVGLPGTGKSLLLNTLLHSTGAPFCIVDCRYADINALVWGTRQGALLDTVLNPLLQKLVMSFRRHLSQSRKTAKLASKIVFRKVLSLERFFYAFLRILAQWTEILVETFGVESPLPTPVIVFDHSHVLMSCDPSLVALLSCLPVHLSSYTNVGCDSCQSTDITVIFSAWTPVVVNDPVPVPTVQFPVYQKQTRESVLRHLFRPLGWPVAQHLARPSSCNAGSDEEHHQRTSLLMEPLVLAYTPTNSESSSDYSDDTDTSDANSDVSDVSDSASTASYSSLHSCRENKVLNVYDAEGRSADRLPSRDSEENSIQCVSYRCEKIPQSSDVSWNHYDYLDGSLTTQIKSMTVSDVVVQQLWNEFLSVLAPHLGPHTLSDFHETLFIVRRLWGIYLLPLLHLDSSLVGLLHAKDLEGVLQELRAKWEKHHCCSHITKNCFSRQLEPPPAGVSTMQYSLPPLFLDKFASNTLRGPPLYVSLHRFEGSVLALVLLVAAFVASTTSPSQDRFLTGVKTGKRRPGNTTTRNVTDFAWLPLTPFPLLRWIRLCQTLFSLLGQPLPASLTLYEQVASLMNINFIVSADKQLTLSGLGLLSGTTKFLCVAPVDVIIDVSARVDLPLDSLVSLGF